MKSPTILLIFRLFFKATRKMDLLCPGKREFLKLTASPFFYRTCEVPALGAFRPPPNTPGPIFSYGRKDGKRPFKGAPAPLKIPRWGALWPRPQTPRPGTFKV